MDRDNSIQIEPREYESLVRESQKTHRNVDEIVNDVIRRHNYAARVQEMRAKLIPLAKKAGYNSDEDIFRDVS
ncbi:MAG: hypothetical protein Q8922_15805 [Bacteroidota bacterium]|nr:hypothetical protein [Bacteroidota bacterium]MDP4232756.1 hypothetical protein [Bacteroidota bacterium]MDP4242562.1 hypothetical protein [Bacteroidota bacterium]MDP4289379.1 hypothetical protein [Bacteroidota bacterium]